MRAYAVLPAGTWDAAREIDSVSLDFDNRHRRRVMLRTVAGNELLLDLAQTVRLRDGDGLLVAADRVIRVRSKPEPLMEIHAADAAALVRIAWHLGNRHLPAQLLADRIRIRADHVIADMVQGLGGHVETLEATFDPEGGAYAGGHPHHHDHDH
jgi:urease accessory protein